MRLKKCEETAEAHVRLSLSAADEMQPQVGALASPKLNPEFSAKDTERATLRLRASWREFCHEVIFRDKRCTFWRPG